MGASAMLWVAEAVNAYDAECCSPLWESTGSDVDVGSCAMPPAGLRRSMGKCVPGNAASLRELDT